MSEYKITLTEAENRALEIVCEEVEENTGRKPTPQEVINDQCAFYIKRMLKSYMKVDVPAKILEGKTDAQQADIIARFKVFSETFDEQVGIEHPAESIWTKLKNYLTGGT